MAKARQIKKRGNFLKRHGVGIMLLGVFTLIMAWAAGLAEGSEKKKIPQAAEPFQAALSTKEIQDRLGLKESISFYISTS